MRSLRHFLLGLFCCACGSSASSTPPADASEHDASTDAADGAADGMLDADATDGVGPPCAVCQPASYTCKSSVPNQESATLQVVSQSSDSCGADLQGSALQFVCTSAQVCREGTCVPFTYDGQELKFTHYGNAVTCHPDK